jgi:hypothetical protein
MVKKGKPATDEANVGGMTKAARREAIMQTLSEMTDSDFLEALKQPPLQGNKELQPAEAPTGPIDSAPPVGSGQGRAQAKVRRSSHQRRDLPEEDEAAEGAAAGEQGIAASGGLLRPGRSTPPPRRIRPRNGARI